MKNISTLKTWHDVGNRLTNFLFQATTALCLRMDRQGQENPILWLAMAQTSE